MKKQLQILSFFITISFLSCNSAVKTIPISDLSTDFPTTEKLEFKYFNKYDILSMGGSMFEGSVLWHFSDEADGFGYCYDLNTGEKLSTIISKGRATNELREFGGVTMAGDSIHFYVDRNIMKTFSKKEMIKNVSMGERNFSITTAPDSILISRMMKLPNGSIVASINTTIAGNPIYRKKEINKNSVVVIDNSEAKFYQTIDYDSFNIEEATDRERDKNTLIKSSYANGAIEVKDNNLAVFSVGNQFILYTLDLRNGKIVNEKRYTKMQRDGGEMSLATMNDMGLEIHFMKSNDKYILCTVGGYFSKEDKESKLRKNAIFVFDWDLNPIKRFDLPNGEIYNFMISNDCDAVYLNNYADEGLTLHKADLNL